MYRAQWEIHKEKIKTIYIWKAEKHTNPRNLSNDLIVGEKMLQGNKMIGDIFPELRKTD